MKTLLSFLILFLSFIYGIAGTGDTTNVLAMDHMDMTWYGAYRDTTVFPDTSLRYRKIYMEVTLGCATGGCSDWDYTVKIEATKLNNSNAETYELGRFMTPYGTYMADGSKGFDNTWEHTFVYDVTDYEQLLRDSVEIIAFYSGWSSGFSATINFEMIEGVPPRDVIKFENLYRGSWRSDNPDTFELNATPPLMIPIDSHTVSAMGRIVPSGHGFVNSQNCAEFCDRDYYLKTDNVIRFTQSMWRDDCGLNPVYPQGGTWLYDRANWCPGDKTIAYDHELTPYIVPGQDLNIDLDLEIYPLTVPSGETPPNYIIDAQLFQYGDYNFSSDAEILDILSPSTKDEHGRKNPICSNPIIKIGNAGSDTLKSLVITYGVEGAATQTYNWAGNLAFMESEIVELEVINDWNGTAQNFEVTISSPNNSTDGYVDNNTMKSSFETVPVYHRTIVVELNTNIRPDENECFIYDATGNQIYYNEMYDSFESYSDTITLEDGCYEFVITDTDKDGLSWWANNDGAGGASFRSPYDKYDVYIDFQPDFGTEIRHQFRVGDLIDGVIEGKEIKMDVFPNPNSGVFTIRMNSINKNIGTYVYSLLGEKIFEKTLSHSGYISLDLSHLSTGSYLLVVMDGDEVYRENITIID